MTYATTNSAPRTKARGCFIYCITAEYMSTLSICLIVKDEEETLPRCLESVKDIADEIVIVDTGSRDKTAEVARRYTRNVYDFAWCEDFSAARNFSFSKAHGDFVMWLDADDVIDKCNAQKIFEIVQSGGFDVAMLKYAAACDKAGNPTFVYFRERIFLRSLGWEWQGAVHEAIEPRGNVKYFDACIYHKKTKINPPMRNLRIYQGLISGGKKLSPREKFYYGRELFFNGMYAESIAVLKDFLSGDGWVENKIEAARTIYRAYVALGKKQEALYALACGFLFSFPHAEDCCILASYFEEQNDVRSAIYWYERALASPEKAEDGGFCNCDCLGYFPAIRLCVLYDKSGDMQKANYYNELAGSFKPDDESYIFNREYFQSKGAG